MLHTEMQLHTYTESRFDCKDTEVYLSYISSVAIVLNQNIYL